MHESLSLLRPSTAATRLKERGGGGGGRREQKRRWRGRASSSHKRRRRDEAADLSFMPGESQEEGKKLFVESRGEKKKTKKTFLMLKEEEISQIRSFRLLQGRDFPP